MTHVTYGPTKPTKPRLPHNPHDLADSFIKNILTSFTELVRIFVVVNLLFSENIKTYSPIFEVLPPPTKKMSYIRFLDEIQEHFHEHVTKFFLRAANWPYSRRGCKYSHTAHSRLSKPHLEILSIYLNFFGVKTFRQNVVLCSK